MADVAYVTSVARKISAQLATRLGIPEPPDAWRAFYAQVANETAYGDPSTRGVRDNNPLNLTDAGGTIAWPGEVGRDAPFAVFGSIDQGITAEVSNYLTPAYVGVQAAFRSGDTGALVSAIEQSPWDAGHYGGALENYLPSAPGVAADHEAGGVNLTRIGRPGSGGNTTGSAGASDAASAAGRGAADFNPFDAIGSGFAHLGDAIGQATSNVMTGVRHFTVAAVVVGAVAALSVAGVRRTLS